MKMLVMHDELGNIKSAAVAPSERRLRAGLKPQRGEIVSEIEVAGLELEELRRNPRLLGEKFRVDIAKARLVRKDP